MAWDLCLGFCEKPLPTDYWIQQLVLQESAAANIYLFTGSGRDSSAGRAFFGFWSDEWFDLRTLSLDASRSCGRLCLAWKIEHSGRGGYQIYCDGKLNKEESAEDPSYVLLPAAGIEKAFRRPLRFIEEDDRVCFPELLLEEEDVSCYRIIKEDRGLKLLAAPGVSRKKLFNYGLEVEPVLPFDTFS